MLKVIIVDDEVWAIEGLKQAINWEKYGCEIVGTFTSAAKALDFLKNSSVDLAFVDVSMPHIDGLTMIERLRQTNSDIHIVIVSGFMEFENARRSVALGVDDFFVKPVDPKSIEDVIMRISKKSSKKKPTDISELARLVKTMRNAKEEDIEVEYFFLKKGYSYFILLMLDPDRPVEKGFIEDTLGTGRETVKCIFLNKYPVLAVFTDIFLDHSSLIHALKLHYPDIQIGVSCIKNSIFDLSEAINECRLAFFSNFITGKNRPCEYKESSRKLFDGIVRRIHSLIKEKDFNKIDMLIEQLFVSDTAFSVDDIILLANCMLMAANINYLDYNFDYIPPADRISERFSNINALREHLHRCISRIAVNDDNISGQEPRKNLMPRLKEYVDEHFQEQISLTVMAEKFGVSEKNIGKLFKKYTGENYTAYVNQSRISMAVKMLSETELSIQEISEICGYRDYSYFARVFKKLTGVSATDIKRNKINKKSNDFNKGDK